MVWSYISSYWSEQLSAKATIMSSLQLLKTQSLPLGRGPHPMFTTCHSPHQARIATIQAKMISGTYRTCYQSQHWQHTTGACLLPNCGVYPGDLLHLFKSCSFLSDTIKEYLIKAKDSLSSFPYLHSLFSRKMAVSSSSALQFLLDPSTDNDVINLPSIFKRTTIPLLFQASHILIWPVHRTRL